MFLTVLRTMWEMFDWITDQGVTGSIDLGWCREEYVCTTVEAAFVGLSAASSGAWVLLEAWREGGVSANSVASQWWPKETPGAICWNGQIWKHISV